MVTSAKAIFILRFITVDDKIDELTSSMQILYVFNDTLSPSFVSLRSPLEVPARRNSDDHTR